MMSSGRSGTLVNPSSLGPISSSLRSLVSGSDIAFGRTMKGNIKKRSIRLLRRPFNRTKSLLMGHARPRPKRLAEKLLKIRQSLGVSQSALIYRLGVELAPNNISTKYEHNLNEPSTDVILAYARLANITLEQLVDDEMELVLNG